jgi:hypothetical protein
MTGEYAAQPQKSDSGQHSALLPKRSDPVTHVFPSHGARVISRTVSPWKSSLLVRHDCQRSAHAATMVRHDSPWSVRFFHLPLANTARHARDTSLSPPAFSSSASRRPTSVGVRCHGAHVPSVPVHLLCWEKSAARPSLRRTAIGRVCGWIRAPTASGSRSGASGTQSSPVLASGAASHRESRIRYPDSGLSLRCP